MLFGIMFVLSPLRIFAYDYDFKVDGIYYFVNEADGFLSRTSNEVSVVHGKNRKGSYTGDVNIPSTVVFGGKTYSVTMIGGDAFEDCSGLTSVSIPNSVTTIWPYAFSGCSGLTSVSIPNSVTIIGSRAFSGCSGLTSVSIPNSVTSIGDGAFSGTPLYDNQNDGLVYIGNVAYGYKGTMPSNTSVNIKEGTRLICQRAFSGCSGLTSVSIPNSVTSIDAFAFEDCSGLTSVSIPNSVTIIGYKAFSGCI